jgi:hypothetical protein
VQSSGKWLYRCSFPIGKLVYACIEQDIFVSSKTINPGMKLKLLFITCLLFAIAHFGFGQRIAKGYYVSLKNDSVPAQFHIPRSVPSLLDLFSKRVDFSSLRDHVDIIDSNGGKSQLLPTEIKGFVFVLDSAVYKMFAKPIDEDRWGFMQPVAMGRKLRLFYYIEIVPGTYTSTPGMHSMNTPERRYHHWTLERYDHIYLFLDDKMPKNQVFAKLKVYFKNDQQILDVIDQKIEEENKKTENRGEIIKAIVDSFNAS